MKLKKKRGEREREREREREKSFNSVINETSIKKQMFEQEEKKEKDKRFTGSMIEQLQLPQHDGRLLVKIKDRMRNKGEEKRRRRRRGKEEKMQKRKAYKKVET